MSAERSMNREMAISDETLLWLFETMLRIRLFEQRLPRSSARVRFPVSSIVHR